MGRLFRAIESRSGIMRNESRFWINPVNHRRSASIPRKRLVTHLKIHLLSSLLFLGIVSTTVAAVNPPTLDLRNARLEMPSLTSAAQAAQVALLIEGAVERHVVVRLHANLSRLDRTKLGHEGVRLLTCLAPRVWIASISVPAVDAAGRPGGPLNGIAWIGDLPTNAKLHPFLAAGHVPTWTIERGDVNAFVEGEAFDLQRLADQAAGDIDPKVVLYVLAHEDVALGDLGDLIEFAGGEVRSQIKTSNGLVVRARMSEINRLVTMDEVLWIEPALPIFEVNNDSNRENTQVDEVRESPYGLDGTGVTVMVYDGGYADASHPDFGGRLTIRDSSGQSSHATHVSGTIGGDGTNSGGTHAGMAPGVSVQSYGFEQEGGLSEGFLYTDPGDLEQDYSDAILNHGAVVANNSIGTNTAPNGFPCDWTGNYGVTSNLIDSVVRGELGGDICIVWANGNERQTDRCGEFFNTTAPPACAKNHITVGATNSNDDSITSFTSWGPSDDGRIKPDITAPGCQSNGDNGVTSTTPGGGYSSYCGTSMASPTVTGIAALIMQDWRQQFPDRGEIRNSSLKALLANSGDDLGNPGPDCMYGFGTVRARQAIDALRDDSVIENEVADGEMAEHLVIVQPGDTELRITLAWDDVPASPLPIAALVNDLDLIVTDPAGDRWLPWTINPADPGAPATRSSEDHLNNIEQVSVADPMVGAWRVQIRGTAVPIGPQEYALAATPSPIACSSTGIVGFGGSAFQPETIVSITVVDCDLNTDDTITDTIAVDIWSDDDPAGFQTVLTETDPAASAFAGSIELTSDAGGSGLYAVDGSTIYVRYLDEMDADGGTNVERIATAIVDGTISAPLSVEAVEFGPDSATIRIVTEEPVRVSISYGLSCDALYETHDSLAMGTDQSVTISGLEDTFTYFYRIQLTDAAGNTSEYGDGAGCFEFTVPDAVDFFAEQFSGGFDLQNMAVRFTRIETADVFAPCAEKITSLPVDPAGGSAISLGDDASSEIVIPFSFQFYGATWNSVYVGSNGYLTFGVSDTTYNESLGAHFSLPRISGLFDDLNPTAGGTVSYRDLGSRLAVTWLDVAEYGTSNSNTFQIILESNGEITIAWLGIDVQDAITGLSPGTGTDPGFIMADFSEAIAGCLPRPPSASDLSYSMAPGGSVAITLSASDDGPMEALVYIVDSLPERDLIDLATGQLITSVPHPLVGGGSGPHLRFESSGAWEGFAEFTYHADDGERPPEGGPSAPATVLITVASGPQIVHQFDFDVDPGWEVEGQWAFGQPSGSGGATGNPDPSGGATGDFVYGYNLNGDYPNNMSTQYLTSSSMDCSGVTGTTLQFERWLGVESAQYDHAAIQISVGGSAFSTVWEHNGGSLPGGNWEGVEYDISSVADGQEDVRIRWVMGTTDGSVVYCGWNIDDVRIIGVVPNNGVPGDLNGDGIVDGADMGLLLSAWGTCGGCSADLNGDGIVDGADMGLLLAYWTSGFAREGMSGDRESDEFDRSVAAGIDGNIVNSTMINDGLLVVAEHEGLIVTEAGFTQTSDGVLVVEIDGQDPIVNSDLVLVNGEARLNGVLQLRIADELRLPSGIFVVMLAESIDGDFAEIDWSGVARDDVTVCRTARAIIVQVGPVFGGELSESGMTMPNEAISMIDALGSTDESLDLDGDGFVTVRDLGLLLRSGSTCN